MQMLTDVLDFIDREYHDRFYAVHLCAGGTCECLLRDKESTDMLDIILNTTVFEICYMWNWGKVCTTIQTAATANNPDLASIFTALTGAAEASIPSAMDAIDK